jgi:hypothetical protein
MANENKNCVSISTWSTLLSVRPVRRHRCTKRVPLRAMPVKSSIQNIHFEALRYASFRPSVSITSASTPSFVPPCSSSSVRAAVMRTFLP